MPVKTYATKQEVAEISSQFSLAIQESMNVMGEHFTKLEEHVDILSLDATAIKARLGSLEAKIDLLLAR